MSKSFWFGFSVSLAIVLLIFLALFALAGCQSRPPCEDTHSQLLAGTVYDRDKGLCEAQRENFYE